MCTPHIPGSLTQPHLHLPFAPGPGWAYTAGPHNGWGEEESPLAALDFAPPSVASGCIATDQWATAIADGTIVRTGTGIAVLDLDGDGDEHTGWMIFYLHLETTTIRAVGTQLNAGDPIGRPPVKVAMPPGPMSISRENITASGCSRQVPLAFNPGGLDRA